MPRRLLPFLLAALIALLPVWNGHAADIAALDDPPAKCVAESSADRCVEAEVASGAVVPALPRLQAGGIADRYQRPTSFHPENLDPPPLAA